MQSAEWYRWFGQNEAAGRSATYERLARSLADNEDLMRLVESLPPPKRQPNLLFATAQWLGAPLEDTAGFLGFVETNWQRFEAEMAQRSVQTNEAARAAAFLPLLAQIEGPVTLIEAGASAGLCLYPDRYGVTYSGSTSQRTGNRGSPVQIEVAVDGPLPLIERDLDVAARIGIDLNPLDAANSDEVAWLEACIWPEHDERRKRLRTAAEVVAADPPTMLQGDLVDRLDDALDLVVPGSTPVIYHSAALACVDQQGRADFAAKIASVRCRQRLVWLSNEGRTIVPGLTVPEPVSTGEAAVFVVAEAGVKVHALADPHGAWIRWR